MYRSVILKMLGLKLVKRDCIVVTCNLILMQLKKLEINWTEPVACLLLNMYQVKNKGCSHIFYQLSKNMYMSV